MHLFYVPNVANGLLSEDESRHAVKVLRLQTGDEIELIDGHGGYYTAAITHPHPSKCGFSILTSMVQEQRPYRLHIAMAPTKNIDRFEWFIEKATEIGIDSIIPLLCHHSERKIVKHERLEKVIVAAAKQSQKARFPELHLITGFEALLKQYQNSNIFIAHCNEGEKTLLAEAVADVSDMLILIGPEGDFSPEEVRKAIQAGAIAVSLGNSRLRTETAGLMACAAVNVLKDKLT